VLQNILLITDCIRKLIAFNVLSFCRSLQRSVRIFHRSKQCWKCASVSLLRTSVVFAFTACTPSNFDPLSSDLPLGNKIKSQGVVQCGDAVFRKERLHRRGKMGWRIVLVKHPENLLFHKSGLRSFTKGRVRIST